MGKRYELWVFVVILGLLAYYIYHNQEQTEGLVKEFSWIWCVAWIPAALVLQHGAYLLLMKPVLKPAIRRTDAEHHDLEKDQAARDQWKMVIDREFSFEAIGLQYFFPTLLNLIAGALLAIMICMVPDCCGKLPEEIILGIRYGGLGALVYVLIMLSERTYQQDVTPGAATWSAVHMVLGPIVGGVIAGIVQGELGEEPRSASTMGIFNVYALYFFAGMAPRQILLVVQNTYRRFFSDSGAVATSKIVPLSLIKGITPKIEERLLEEGISDSSMLAMANPVRLLRNTPFEERQILSWIDQALLHTIMMDYAPLIIKEGITGAIDLAYYHNMFETKAETDTAINALATVIKMDSGLLTLCIRRLNEDAQVQQIWIMYQGSLY